MFEGLGGTRIKYSDDETTAEIEKFMSDLQLEDMLTVEVPAGQEVTFYLYVDKWPSKIKFVYSV